MYILVCVILHVVKKKACGIYVDKWTCTLHKDQVDLSGPNGIDLYVFVVYSIISHLCSLLGSPVKFTQSSRIFCGTYFKLHETKNIACNTPYFCGSTLISGK